MVQRFIYIFTAIFLLAPAQLVAEPSGEAAVQVALPSGPLSCLKNTTPGTHPAMKLLEDADVEIILYMNTAQFKRYLSGEDTGEMYRMPEIEGRLVLQPKMHKGVEPHPYAGEDYEWGLVFQLESYYDSLRIRNQETEWEGNIMPALDVKSTIPLTPYLATKVYHWHPSTKKASQLEEVTSVHNLIRSNQLRIQRGWSLATQPENPLEKYE